MKKNDIVRVNKKMNLDKVDIEEGFHNLYVNILQIFNKTDKYDPIVFEHDDLLKLLGTNSKNSKYLNDIFVKLTGSNEIKLDNKKFYGSVFSVEKDEKKGNYTIYVNDPYKKLLFTKSDIDLMYKAKNYRHLKLTTEEQEQWKTLKDKRKFMMLLDNSSIKALRGKNNKIIYSMLKEFSGSQVKGGENKGLKYRKISYTDFKIALKLDEKYRNNNIDRILTKAKEDITKLTELTITEIKTFPEGRGSKKTHMIIFFCDKNEEKKKKYDDDLPFADIIGDDIKDAEVIEPEVLEFRDEKAEELKALVKEHLKTLPDVKKYELSAKLIILKTKEEIQNFIDENKLEVNRKLF